MHFFDKEFRDGATIYICLDSEKEIEWNFKDYLREGEFEMVEKYHKRSKDNYRKTKMTEIYSDPYVGYYGVLEVEKKDEQEIFDVIKNNLRICDGCFATCKEDLGDFGCPTTFFAEGYELELFNSEDALFVHLYSGERSMYDIQEGMCEFNKLFKF